MHVHVHAERRTESSQVNACFHSSPHLELACSFSPCCGRPRPRASRPTTMLVCSPLVKALLSGALLSAPLAPRSSSSCPRPVLMQQVDAPPRRGGPRPGGGGGNRGPVLQLTKPLYAVRVAPPPAPPSQRSPPQRRDDSRGELRRPASARALEPTRTLISCLTAGPQRAIGSPDEIDMRGEPRAQPAHPAHPARPPSPALA